MKQRIVKGNIVLFLFLLFVLWIVQPTLFYEYKKTFHQQQADVQHPASYQGENAMHPFANAVSADEAHFAAADRTEQGRKKQAFLTFDDGPSHNTSVILDTLRHYNVKATFFVTGTEHSNLVQRMHSEGHVIGNHTMTHDYSKIYESSDAFWADFFEQEAYLKGIIGETPVLMRFPGGSNNSVSRRYGGADMMNVVTQQAQQKGYVYVDWNVSSGDALAVTLPKEDIVSNVLEGAKQRDNAVILMHQTEHKTTTAEALPEVIEGLTNMGFEFSPLTVGGFCPRFLE